MPRLYRPQLGAQSLHSSLKGMVQYRGGRMSDRRFKEVLLKSGDKDLQKFAYQKSGKTTAHQAKKIIKKFAKHVHEQKELGFSYKARQQGIGELSKTGKVSDIATRNFYQDVAEREAKAEMPTGPTPEEIRKQKIHEERIKQRNIANRSMANEIENRQRKKEETITSISEREKRENVGNGKAPKEQEHKSSIRMPMMSGGIPRTGANPQNVEKLAEQSFEREPPMEQVAEEGSEEVQEELLDESIEEPIIDEEATEAPSEATSESPPKAPEEPSPVDVDRGLPLGE